MRNVLLRLLAATTVGLFLTPRAHACEPCPEILGFDQTVKVADLIIIGERTDYSPEEAKAIGRGPDTVKVRVLNVLKGTTPGNIITVNAWDGMCRYGIVVDAAPHLMILQSGVGQFNTVESGCGVSAIPLVNGTVTIDGKPFTPTELQRRIAAR